MTKAVQDALISSGQALTGIKKKIDIAGRNTATSQDPNSVAHQVLISRSTNGGVNYNTIERVNESHLTNGRNSLLTLSAQQTELNTLKTLETLFGEKGDLNSFAHLGDAMTDSLRDLASSNRADFSGAKTKAINDMQDFLASVQTFSKGVQSSRRLADEEVKSGLSSINEILQNIAKFNISKLQDRAENFDSIQGQRESLNNLALQAGFYVQRLDDGTLKVYTDVSGKYNLVDGGRATQFNYTSPATYTPSTVFGEITATYIGTTFTNDHGGTDLTAHLAAIPGPLSKNLYLRDTLMPSLNDQLNKVTGNLCENFNTIHNEGVSNVLRPQIIGEGLASGIIFDPSQLSGTVRFALMDNTNKLAPATTFKEIDLSDYNTYLGASAATLTSFSNFLNAQFSGGTAIGINASIQNNQLILTSTNPAYGIAIGENETLPTNIQLQGSSNGEKFSKFFGLNNLFSTSVPLTDPEFSSQLRIRPDIAQNLGRSMAVGRLCMDATLSPNSSIIEGSDIAITLSDSWNNDIIQFSATSTLGATESSLSEYVRSLITNHSQMVISCTQATKVAERIHERASAEAARTSKLDPDQIEQELADLASFQKTIIQIMMVALSFKEQLNKLKG
jgi:flagellar hook-associated protein FlgK